MTDEPPAKRDIAMVFQSYALYPHMEVRENLEFGLRRRRTPRRIIADKIGGVAGVLGLRDLLERRPGQLSGGQRQRVAIGRAMVREPVVYLMDEPLSNLDAKLRVSMRAELARLHDRLGVTTVYVTHDQIEAMTLGDRVCVMLDGTIQQVDTPSRLFGSPANTFVAAAIGSPAMNLAVARVDGDAVVFGELRLALPAARRALVRDRREVVVGLRPTDFRLRSIEFALDDGAAPPTVARLSVTAEVVEGLGAEQLAGLSTLTCRGTSPRAATRGRPSRPRRPGPKTTKRSSPNRRGAGLRPGSTCAGPSGTANPSTSGSTRTGCTCSTSRPARRSIGRRPRPGQGTPAAAAPVGIGTAGPSSSARGGVGCRGGRTLNVALLRPKTR